MKRHLLAGAAALALALPTHAQTAAELSRQYAELPANQQMMDSMLSAEAMTAQLAAGLPPGMGLSDDQLQRIGAIMADEMSALRPQLEDAMIAAGAEIFTVAELQALIDFYGSETGAAILGKMQPFMQAYMADVAPGMMQIQQQTMPQIMQIMQE